MSFKIYTKTGDRGETGLFGGERVPKNHLRIEAYGTIDELNSYIGLLKDLNHADKPLTLFLKDIQDTLFVIGAQLATPSPTKANQLPQASKQDIEALENAIDLIDEKLPPLKNFILPGGHIIVSHCHIARCICRRAERAVVSLHQHEAVDMIMIEYLNRLSDYLFILARKLAQDLNAPEIAWKTTK